MVEIKFDKKKIEKATGCEITEDNITRTLKEGIGFLYTHNKNLTRQQWITILALQDIVDAIIE